MAQFLLCAGAPGQRSAHAHSRILMHQPLGAVEGYAVDIAIQAEQFTLARRLMAELTARAHRPDRRADHSPTATATAGSPPTEALEYGMIDEVIAPRT